MPRASHWAYAALCAAVLAAMPLRADELAPINPAPGARSWTWQEHGISVRLTQILPDQLRGFYLARGFDAAAAERIAKACVFQTVIRNVSAPGPVDLDLRRWRTHGDSGRLPLQIKEDWLEQWQAQGTGAKARLAFRWALFPTTQRFRHGDWNMGMTLYGLPPESAFAVKLAFTVDGNEISGRIDDVRCPAYAAPSTGDGA